MASKRELQNVMNYKFAQRSCSLGRTEMRRTRVKAGYGENITFLADYLFLHPGATSSECRKALCEFRGIDWEGATRMRGQYTTYFTTGWIGSTWRNNPCGRYWTRMTRPDGRPGFMLTIEGVGKVGLYEEAT